MLYRFLTMLAIVALMVFSAAQAEARRGFIPIPGGAEILVKVVDMPHTPEFLLKDGKHVDLGYKFNSYWQGGEWIGHIGSDSQYVALTETQMAVMLKAANLTTLPPVPSRPWTFVNALWLIILGFVGVGVALKLLRGKAAGASASPAGLMGGGEAQPAQTGKAHVALDRLLTQREAPSPAAPSPTPRAGLAGPRASFGRRNT